MYLWLIWENNISIKHYNQRNEELAFNQLKNASHLTILKFTTQNEIKFLYNILNKCVIKTSFWWLQGNGEVRSQKLILSQVAESVRLCPAAPVSPSASEKCTRLDTVSRRSTHKAARKTRTTSPRCANLRILSPSRIARSFFIQCVAGSSVPERQNLLALSRPLP
jgi:hypothetical protein